MDPARYNMLIGLKTTCDSLPCIQLTDFLAGLPLVERLNQNVIKTAASDRCDESFSLLCEALGAPL